MNESMPKPTEWHRRPRGCRGRCPICGLPSQHRRQHRAIAPDEERNGKWLTRVKSPAGWQYEEITNGDIPTPADISPETQQRVKQAAVLACKSKTYQEIADTLGVARETVKTWRQRYFDIWEASPVGRPMRENRIRKGGKPPPQEMVAQAAELVAEGKTFKHVAAVMGVCRATIQMWRSKYPKIWEAAGKTRGRKDRPASPRTQQRIAKAAALAAQGKSDTEVTNSMNIRRQTLHYWRTWYPGLWDSAIAAVADEMIQLVRAEAGTDAVLEDPESYLHRAELADKWCDQRGKKLFPENGKPTLATVYRDWYLPTRLFDASPRTTLLFRMTLKRWRLITGDPPIEEITVKMLAGFRDVLGKLRGLKPHLQPRPATVKSKLEVIQTLLDRAGPPGPRNRDAAGIIPGPVPWVKPPRVELEPPRVVTDEQLNAAYQAAVAMEWPKIPGIKPPRWWKALLVFVFNTGLPTSTVFALRMEWIDWVNCRLTIPARRMKSRRGHVLHLNSTVMDHLRRIRTDREMVFPLPGRAEGFYSHFHKLQDAAGLPMEDHFGLQDLRRTLGTRLWTESPQAAQLALGHTDSTVTREHYIFGPGIVAAALDHLPQPAAFVGTTSKRQPRRACRGRARRRVPAGPGMSP